MGTRRCAECLERPAMRCGRCSTTRCVRHALEPGVRCDRCELDWDEDAPTRRAPKVLVAPAIAVLAGGVLFGLLLPVSVGGAIGTTVMCAVACGTAAAAGVGACRLFDKTARALFLRERAGSLPPARLLPPGTR